VKIGIDFDNTIVTYEQLFHQVALEQDLIPADLVKTKVAVRGYLREKDQEEAWTTLQGYVYGARMSDAALYPGIESFFEEARKAQHELFIISHKTKKPFLGPPYDLHQAAKGFLEQQSFFNITQGPITQDNVFFNETKAEKIKKIVDCQCDIFIDDLPEILLDSQFPTGTRPILFDPNQIYSAYPQLNPILNWQNIQQFISKCP
jgi:hypothetical protein